MDIGLIGLAVMGQNLVLNMERRGFRLAVYNRTAEVTRKYLAGPASEKQIQGTFELTELAATLKRPRVVMLMVKAGNPVDGVIESLKPHLDPGDVVIDGGNSFYKDTERRTAELAEAGIHFLGVGISGGEEGALRGPSVMPGGAREAYARAEPIFSKIAAMVGDEPCVTYIGPGGSGHYVKMVHNGIEYGVMQLIAEIYDLLGRGLRLSAEEMTGIFKKWNRGSLESYLIEITADILERVDEESGNPLVDAILDQAAQKGTGKWTSQEAFDLGIPVPTISAAVEARSLSAFQAGRKAMTGAFSRLPKLYSGPADAFAAVAGEALYTAMILTYAQGMNLLKAASREYRYDIRLSEVARVWRGGCIIRAGFLEEARRAYAERPDLLSLPLWPSFQKEIKSQIGSLQHVLATAIDLGIPVPALSSALAYYDSYRSERLPASLIQAQRDYFGAHTYQRTDREGTFHTEWVREE